MAGRGGREDQRLRKAVEKFHWKWVRGYIGGPGDDRTVRLLVPFVKAQLQPKLDEIRSMREFMARTEVAHDECCGTGGIAKAKDCRPCKGSGAISALKLYEQENG